jgi:outer membrane protein TolC
MVRCEKRSASTRPWAFGLLAVVLLASGGEAAAQESPPPQAPQVPALLKLSDAIDLALRGSNRLGIENATLEAARKDKTAAWFALGPDLTTSASYGERTLRNFGAPEPAAVDESKTYDYGASASIRLFDGLANYSRVKAAGHDIRQQEHTTEYARQQVVETVIEAYCNLLRAKLLLNVAKEGEAVAREQLQRTQSLYELGSAARSDVLKQQVQHDNTRLNLVKANQFERQSTIDLEWAMNLETSTPFEIDTTVTRIQFVSKEFETERDYALVHRENLLSFRAGEQAANSRVWEARGLLWPTLDFRYTMSYSENDSRLDFTSSKSDFRNWVFFANWDIWDRYNKYSAISRAKSNRRISEYQRRQAELDAIREVQSLVNTMDEARERLSVSRQNVASAREDLRLATEKFRVGAGTILDTVQAQSDLTLAQANEVQAIVDYLIARAKLARATGRPLREV